MIPLERVSGEQRENEMSDVFDGLRADLVQVRLQTALGRVIEIAGNSLRVAGLGKVASQGDRVLIGGHLSGEIVSLGAKTAQILTEGNSDGLSIGCEVRLTGKAEIAPHESWIGRVIDPDGQPLDGRPLVRGLVNMALKAQPPKPNQRRRLGERLSTGVAVFDTVLPLVRGQRIGLFAGSGVGKSTLLAQFARGVEADVVVIALIGERGRELREFVERVLGEEGMARAIVITATSDRPALTRRKCAWTAMAVAEFFRDMGLHVLFLADSITRFAEAHREIATASGEAATLRGFPPSLSQAIMSLAERSGPGEEGKGDITAIFSVLVAGSDMEEPVADILRGVLDGHVVMDRTIAERGRYPAIDLLKSVSRSLPHAANEEENLLIAQARRYLGAWEKVELMVQAGLYAKGSDPLTDQAIKVFPALDAFLAEAAPSDGVDGSFGRLAAVLNSAR